MKKYFLVYNDDSHTEDLDVLLDSVRIYSDFEIIIFDKKDISPEFIEKNKEILDCERGGGYWLWKSYIICKTLDDETIQQGDLLFYMDSKYFFLEPFEGLYLDKMKDRDILVWQNKPCEPVYQMKEWCKMDVVNALNIYDAVFNDNISIGWAGAIVLRKNEKTMQIMREWLNYCCNYQLITDNPSILPESPFFVEHRHDQSILSAVLHLHEIPMEYFECRYLQNVRFPFFFY